MCCHRGQCYKNTAITAVKSLLFLGLKYHSNLLPYCSNLPSFQGKFNVVNILMVIYSHATVITKIMLLYNTEWWYDHGMAVNYHGKKIYSIGPWCQKLVVIFCYWQDKLPFEKPSSDPVHKCSKTFILCHWCSGQIS
jgi:hypothetical protein